MALDTVSSGSSKKGSRKDGKEGRKKDFRFVDDRALSVKKRRKGKRHADEEISSGSSSKDSMGYMSQGSA